MRPRPRRGAAALAVVTLLALVLAACQQGAPAVETAEVVEAEVTETVTAPGVVDVVAREEVRAEVAGRVADVAVADGSAVRAGEVVVRLESPQLDTALEEAEQALADLEAAVEAPPAVDLSIDPLPPPPNPAADAVARLDAEVRPRLDAARAAIDEAAAQATLPEEVADALPDGASSAQGPAGAEAQAALDALEGTYEGVRDALLEAGEAATAQQRALSTQVSASVAEVQAALDEALAAAAEQATAAQRAQADAAREQAAAQREALVVEAPSGGVVELGGAAPALPDLGALGDLTGRAGPPGGGEDPLAGADASGVGQWRPRAGAAVSPGQTLFTVLDDSAWYVEADIDEIDAPAVVEGQRATVVIEAFGGQELEGVVESLALTARRGLAGGVAFPARVRLLDPPEDPGPRVGMTASVEITTRTVEADLAVPARAVVRRDVGTAVYAVRDGVAVLVPVELVAQGGELAAVEGALEVGERVVVAGYEDLADGSRVRAP